jgi:antagonist of KipI
LRVTQGPQASLLPFDALLTTDHEVSHRLDRVGVRLSPEDRFEHSIELASEPSVFGAVQITPSGEPIVLGPDGPTIGGYPKIAVVIHADLDRIGQLRPGDRVSFEHVTLDEARRIGSENRNRLRDLRNLVNASEFSR